MTKKEKKVCKIYKEVVEDCDHCPKNSPDWWSNEWFCTALQPSRASKKSYPEGFPSWCPLEDYEVEEEG